MTALCGFFYEQKNMTMKQTQTKVFRFSDVDLDLTPASKIKLPIAFKKILSSGYNTQIVSSVSVSGGSVTLSYGKYQGSASISARFAEVISVFV